MDLFVVIWPVLLAYILLRNNWVYRRRMDLLLNDKKEYERLPDYFYMLLVRFWVWDIKKFTR